jgi:hypothetical protein
LAGVLDEGFDRRASGVGRGPPDERTFVECGAGVLLYNVQTVFLAVQQPVRERQQERASAVAQSGFAQAGPVSGGGGASVEAAALPQCDYAPACWFAWCESPAYYAVVGNLVDVPTQSRRWLFRY